MYQTVGLSIHYQPIIALDTPTLTWNQSEYTHIIWPHLFVSVWQYMR